MSDRLHHNVRAALRQALLSLSKATLTASDLAFSAATGALTRGAGSFLDDNFAAGDEVQMSGWPASSGLNAVWYVRTCGPARLTLAPPEGRAAPTVNGAAGIPVTLSAGLPLGQKDENSTFAPIPGQPWFRESYKPGPEVPRSLSTLFAAGHASQASVRMDFLYMLSVIYPSGQGTLGVDGMADTVRATLWPGRVLTYNGQHVTILSTSRQGLQEKADWCTAPLSVRGYAYTLTP